MRKGQKVALPVFDVLRNFFACVSCIAENQRGMIGLQMREDELRDALPCMVVCDGHVWFGKQTDFHIKLPCVGAFDDGDWTWGGRGSSRGSSSHESRCCFGWLDGG